MFKLTIATGIKNQKGFTLVEMAIVIMIIGLLIASMVPLYDLYKKKQAITTTDDNVAIASSAIGSFRSINGRYPCPADLAATRDDVNYGTEDADCKAQTGTQRTLAAGNCTIVNTKTGLCIEQSTRANANFKYPVTAAAATQPIRVLVGALPFRELNMYEKDSFDGYGDRILYIVTQHLTCADCFIPDQGGIAILDQNGASAITPDASAHFLVLSAGENGMGAYAASGTRIPCTGADPNPEHENCDYNENPAQANATYAISEANSDNTSGQHYDDVMSYFTQDEMPLWQYSTSPANPYAINNKTSGNVGVGISSAIDDKGKVTETVRAQDDTLKTPAIKEGKVQSTQFCDYFDGSCMQSRLLAGDSNNAGEGIKCADPTKFMQGIRLGQAICGDIVTKCDPGLLMHGIKANGEPDCGAPPPKDCEPITVDLCPPDVAGSLPAAANGETKTAHAGSDRAQDFVCNDGSWNALNLPYGNCTCTPGTVTTGGIGCGTGFNGSYSTTTTTTCTPATTVTVTDTSAADCTCVDTIEPQDLNCPPGYTDNDYHQTQHHICDVPGGRWEDPVIVGSCTCEPHDPEINPGVACEGGLDGTKTQQREFDTGSCQFGDWHDTDTHLCHCEEHTYYGTDSCPVGSDGTVYDGTIEIKLDIKCVNGVPTASSEGWVPTGTRNCVPQEPRHCKWIPNDNGIIQNAGLPQSVGDPCPVCGASSRFGCSEPSGTQYKNHTSCTCN